ncbi:histidine decarboxylase, pyruvoyl type [Desulfobacca acetoxidans]|uniref:histidine decarboxylase n=1 Tax=Desulfobacca acetoxidans (strain ATCC 700848 / DSM 11109 / ASRB2) TaxID=880072 RepID=F2NE50_DESAR|nr:histidine decarboxylase, pyruvoyl type [Desulfobacca acetoxidans]AEB10680.1 Histidine decarboxylase [Desulfobacca acetoxidans DSM 11109]
MVMTREDAVAGAIGPYERFCDGYGNPGASGLGYLTLMKLDIGESPLEEMDATLAEIVSYDSAETTGTYLGQINAVTASSFCGPNGLLWGYDIAPVPEIADGSLLPIFFKTRKDGVEIPVYSLEPLLQAGQKLLGLSDRRRFPPIPGARVTCALKSHAVKGPNSLWAALAVAIAEDRSQNAHLFIEDVGEAIPAADEAARQFFLDRLMEKIALSILYCGDNSQVKYKEIFMGYKTAWIEEGYMGCALASVPYLVLARQAVPPGGPATLLSLSLPEWEKAVGLHP